jgi:Lar family restriction alleviation protein
MSDEEPTEGARLLAELRDSGFVGAWADREDIGDSSEFARQLRTTTWQAEAHRRLGATDTQETTNWECPTCGGICSSGIDHQCLRPCPFCGGEGIMHRCGLPAPLPPQGIEYIVRCRCCAAEGGWGKHERTAIRNWNRRVGEKGEPCQST